MLYPMIGFGVFGLLIYYLALYYRPMRLLDSMLAHMASEMPEALFFFDANGQCIWANNRGIALAGIQSGDFDAAPTRLRELFGDYAQSEIAQREVSVGEPKKNYVLGDRVLQKIAETIRHSFRAEDCVCRIGGDEFVVFMTHTGEKQKSLIVSKVNQINAELANTKDGLPLVSVSVGIAHGRGITDPGKLFEHADQALYETKHRGKKGFTFYDDSKAFGPEEKEAV